MQTFFQGWRRTIGYVVLILALVSMAAWIKSQTAGDVVHVSTRRHYNMFFSAAGRVYWWSMLNVGGVRRVLWHDDMTADELIVSLDKDRPDFQRNELLQFRVLACHHFADLGFGVPDPDARTQAENHDGDCAS